MSKEGAYILDSLTKERAVEIVDMLNILIIFAVINS